MAPSSPSPEALRSAEPAATSRHHIGGLIVKGKQALSASAVFGAAISVYAMRRADPDLWGYLAYGRLFVRQGWPVSSDPFSYTCTDCTWVPFEYLAQVLLWLAYNLGGPAGLIGLKCLVGAVCVYFVSVAVRTTSGDPDVWVPVFLLATSTVARFFLFRPQLFTFALFALYVAILLRHLLVGSKAVLILPAVMLVWANLHGGFLAGLAVLGLALLLRIGQNANAFGAGLPLLTNTRLLLGSLFASTAVTFLNPMGSGLWRYVLNEILHSTNRRYIAEWRPALLAGDYWSTVSLTLMVLMLVAVGWALRRNRSLIGGLYVWQWMASCVPPIAMAYLSVRHVPLAAIWLAPVTVLLAARLKEHSGSRRKVRRLWTAASAVAITPTFLILTVLFDQPWPRIDVAGTTLGKTNPCRAVAYMRASRFSGNVYVPLWWGSYVTWHLFPSVKVSMDGRNVSLFPDEMVVENLRFYIEPGAEIDVNAPFRYETDMLLVPADSSALPRVRSDARWQEVFSDRDSSLFGRVGRLPAALSAAETAAAASSACPEWVR